MGSGDCRCLIPAAGKGTRMRPLTHTLPKAMLSVAAKPTIFHIIDSVHAVGVKKFTIITGYLKELMESEILAAYPDLEIDFVEQEEQLGLGHAIYQARDHVRADEPLLIVYGDTLFEANLALMLESKIPVIGVYPVEDPRRFGVVELHEDKVGIKNLVEKPEVPPSNLAIPGVNFFPDSKILFDTMGEIIREDIRTKNEYQITDAFVRMLTQKNIPMEAMRLSAWYDCGTLPELLKTNREMLAMLPQDNLQVEGAKIIPPVSIGKNCQFKNATIGPHVSLADNCVIHDSVLTDSILDKETTISGSQLKSSLLGRRAKVDSCHGTLIIGDDSSVQA